MSNLIEKEPHAGIILLRLNRPTQGNSLTGELLQELKTELEAQHRNPELKALCLTGAGSRFFCTGADLKDLHRSDIDRARTLRLFSEVLELLGRFECLTASMLNGDCLGGGLGLALSTDFILAAEHARIGTPEITKQIFPFLISGRLREKLGNHRAAALAFSGKMWSAPEAFQFGIVSELAGSNQFEQRTEELFTLWNKLSGDLIRQGKGALSGSSSQQTLASHLDDSIKRRDR